jgi:hypothetical protein
MRQIYQNAKKTIAYVGKEDDDCSLAVRYMNDLFQRVRQRMADLINLVRADPSLLMGHMSQDISQDLAMEATRTLGGNGDDSFGGFNAKATQKAIVSFLSRPWFRRVWIIQEFVVSQEVVLVCGKQTCEYCSFMAAFGYAFEESRLTWSGAIAGSQMKDFCKGLSQMRKLIDRKNVFHKEIDAHPPLLGLLKEYRTSLATIANDKIYALTGLSMDYADFKPNYQTSKQDLFRTIQFLNRWLTGRPIGQRNRVPDGSNRLFHRPYGPVPCNIIKLHQLQCLTTLLVVFY